MSEPDQASLELGHFPQWWKNGFKPLFQTSKEGVANSQTSALISLGPLSVIFHAKELTQLRC